MRPTDGYVVLKGLRFHAYHGVLPQERLVGNDYVVSLRIKCDLGPAMRSDDVADTINYAEVSDLVAREMAIPSSLLEGLAGRMGERLLRRYPQIEELDLYIYKVNPPMGADCQGAGIEVHLINDKTLESI